MRLTVKEKQYAIEFANQYDKLERQNCDLVQWYQLKLSCSYGKAKALSYYAANPDEIVPPKPRKKQPTKEDYREALEWLVSQILKAADLPDYNGETWEELTERGLRDGSGDEIIALLTYDSFTRARELLGWKKKPSSPEPAPVDKEA